MLFRFCWFSFIEWNGGVEDLFFFSSVMYRLCEFVLILAISKAISKPTRPSVYLSCHRWHLVISHIITRLYFPLLYPLDVSCVIGWESNLQKHYTSYHRFARMRVLMRWLSGMVWFLKLYFSLAFMNMMFCLLQFNNLMYVEHVFIEWIS